MCKSLYKQWQDRQTMKPLNVKISMDEYLKLTKLEQPDYIPDKSKLSPSKVLLIDEGKDACIDDMRLVSAQPPFGHNCLALFNHLEQKTRNYKLKIVTHERHCEGST